MKKAYAILLFIAVAMFFFRSTVNASDDKAKLTFYLGDVHTRIDSENNWGQAKLQQILSTGYELKTGIESRAEITFTNKGIVRVGEKSLYVLNDLSQEEGAGEIEGSLFKGRIWANVKKITGKEDKFNIRTTTAVAAVRGTVFRIDVLTDSTTELYVYKGAVEVGGPQWAPDYGKEREWKAPQQVEGPKEVAMDQWTEIVREQQKLVVGPKGMVSKSEFNIDEDKKDDWVDFNLKRDLSIIESGRN
ncbi:MAG: FecR domain-containing protein [candidate division Zixibacteria bacterium]|nr:FecR domain-containing protein [candidate division Zixibacteria bacterium]